MEALQPLVHCWVEQTTGPRCTLSVRRPLYPPELRQQQFQQVPPVLVPHHVQLIHHHTAQLLQTLLLQHAADQRIGLLYCSHDDTCKSQWACQGDGRTCRIN